MAELDFSRRAELVELMDEPCSYEDFRGCLRHIERVNRLSSAYRPTLEFLDRIVRKRGMSSALRIVDVGSGYGDFLRRIERWAAERGVAVSLTGVDLHPYAIRAAREASPPESRIEWVESDAVACDLPADVIINSLLTHHLSEPEIVRLLGWTEQTARAGWFINDLHRKPVPYYLFGALALGPWWHRFTRHDGMASIRRSFLAEDWERMLAAAGVAGAEVLTFRPARLCVERVK